MMRQKCVPRGQGRSKISWSTISDPFEPSIDTKTFIAHLALPSCVVSCSYVSTVAVQGFAFCVCRDLGKGLACRARPVPKAGAKSHT